MKILGNRVLATHITVDRAGSIFLPHSLTDFHNVGGPKVFRIVSVGTGGKTKKGHRIPIECEPGDRIICHSYTAGPQDSGLPDGTFILTTDQILAVIPKQTP